MMSGKKNRFDFAIIAKEKPKVMHLVLAENGSSQDYPITDYLGQTVAKLQQTIENDFSIPKIHQIILRSDGKQLEAKNLIAEVIESDTTLYIFNREFYREEPSNEDFQLVLDNPSLQKQMSESSILFTYGTYEAHLGEDIRKYLDDRSRDTFDRIISAFSYIKSEIKSALGKCQRLNRQRDAETCAKKNLVKYYNEKRKLFDEKIKELNSKISVFKPTLERFEDTLAYLAKTEVHTSLQQEGKRYLLDYFNVEKIKALKAACEQNQDKISQKSQEISKEIQDYDASINNITENIDRGVTEIQDEIKHQEQLFIDIFDVHFQEFKMLLEKKGSKMSKSDIYEFGKAHVGPIETQAKSIIRALDDLSQKIETVTINNGRKLRDFIGDVSLVQIALKEKISNKLKSFSALTERHEKDMHYLSILEKFPEVYERSLQEIRRRAGFKRRYLDILDMLEKYAFYENKTREEFIEENGEYLPRTFCLFLTKKFPMLNNEQVKNVVESDLPIDLAPFQKDMKIDVHEGDEDLVSFHDFQDIIEKKDAKIGCLEKELIDLKMENEKLLRTIKPPDFTKILESYRQVLPALIDQSFNTHFRPKAEAPFIDLQEKIEKLETQIQKFVSMSVEKISEYRMLLTEEQKKNAHLSQEFVRTMDLLVKATKELEDKKSKDEKIKEIHQLKKGLSSSESKLQEQADKFKELEVSLKSELDEARDNFKRSQIIQEEAFVSLLKLLPNDEHCEYLDKGANLENIRSMIDRIEKINSKKLTIIDPEPGDTILLGVTEYSHYIPVLDTKHCKTSVYFVTQNGKLLQHNGMPIPNPVAKVISINKYKADQEVDLHNLYGISVKDQIYLIEVKEVNSLGCD